MMRVEARRATSSSSPSLLGVRVPILVLLLLLASPPFHQQVAVVRAWTPTTPKTTQSHAVSSIARSNSSPFYHRHHHKEVRRHAACRNDDDVDGGHPTQPTVKSHNIVASWVVALQIVCGSTLALPFACHASIAPGDVPTVVKEETVTDQVWNLMNKFYLDKNNHVKDWPSLYSKYSTKTSSRSGGISNMVTQMVKGDDGAKYNRILSPSEYEAIQRFDLIGVGATLMPEQQPSDNQGDDSGNAQEKAESESSFKSKARIIVGAPPIPGSPADKVGLRVGDIIAEVNGISTTGKTAFDIIDQITENNENQAGGNEQAGKQKTTVTMTILPKEHANELDNVQSYTRQVTMDRAIQGAVSNPIRYKLVKSINDNDNNNNVGYIRISEFNSMVVPKLEEAITELTTGKNNAKALVLDIRHNTGGAFQSAIEISSLFLEDKVSTYVVDNSQTKIPFTTSKNHKIVNDQIPLIIWMDGKSASAAEVLAGSLHDNCRAILVGEHSFGKGLIQAVYGLQDGEGLVLTVARYLTPSGYNIQGHGLDPDIQISDTKPHILGWVADLNEKDISQKLNLIDIQQRLSPTMCQVPAAVSTTSDK